MKAIIPVAGAGILLRPHTYTQPKPLIPVAGKPILAFIVDQIIEAGIRDFTFITGYLGDKIRLYIEANYPDIKKTFITQTERLGSAHALYIAEETYSDDDELLIVFGDTIADMDLGAFLSEETGALAVRKVKNPREVGIAEIDTDGFATKLSEKPAIPKSNLALVGLYKIKETKAFKQAVKTLVKENFRTHGEFQLTDVLMAMIKDGIPFKTVEVSNWLDCGKKEILLETNALLLKRQGSNNPSNQSFTDAILIPPVFIGENCEITQSIIGPNVSLGNNTRIQSSIIADSIIGNFTELHNVALHHSIIGNDSFLQGPRQSLNIGDNTEIDFR
jgi:glucose-1-phosphate thymidylyltransferase